MELLSFSLGLAILITGFIVLIAFLNQLRETPNHTHPELNGAQEVTLKTHTSTLSEFMRRQYILARDELSVDDVSANRLFSDHASCAYILGVAQSAISHSKLNLKYTPSVIVDILSLIHI